MGDFVGNVGTIRVTSALHLLKPFVSTFILQGASRMKTAGLVLVSTLFITAATGLTAQNSTQKAVTSRKYFTNSELTYSIKPLPSGEVKVKLVTSGFHGLEVRQVSSNNLNKTLSQVLFSADRNVSYGSPNITDVSLDLERETGSDCITLIVSEISNPNKHVKIVLPANSADSGRVTVKSAAAARYLMAGDDADEEACAEGTVRVGYNSARCGSISTCCPSGIGVSINGVSCTITCGQ